MQHRRARISIALALTFLLGTLAPSPALPAAAETPTLRAVGLQTELRTDPIGIDRGDPDQYGESWAPRLSWVPEWSGPGNPPDPGSYRIRAAWSIDDLADGPLTWDSGRVVVDPLTFDPVVRYPTDLISRTRYFWQVKLWDTLGNEGEWSAVAFFQTGLLDPSDWGDARWIAASSSATKGAAIDFRRRFEIGGAVRRATLTVAALGFGVPMLNGVRVSDHEMDAPFSQYDKRILYSTYDVSALVRAGSASQPAANVLGVVVGSGWYNQQAADSWDFATAPWIDREKLIARLDIELADGTVQHVVSDRNWTWATGEHTYASFRGGEDIDHSKARAWNITGAPFRRVALRAPRWSPRLVAASVPPERRLDVVPFTVTAKEPASTLPSGTTRVYTLDKNVSMGMSITLRGDPGTVVRMQVGEGLCTNPDGCGTVPHGMVDPAWHNLNGRTDGGKKRWQLVNLTLAGGAAESFATQFTYFAGRFVDLTVVSGQLTAEPALEVRRLHTDVTPTSSFSTSDAKLQTLHEAAMRTYLNNLHGFPTDSPQRERLGYGADGLVAAEIGLLNFDTAAIYEQWLDSFRDAQADNGYVYWVAPTSYWTSAKWYSPWWGNALSALPWMLQRDSGQAQMLYEQQNAMVAWAEYLLGQLDNGLWVADNFAPDHLAADQSDDATFNSLAVYAAFRDVAALPGLGPEVVARWTSAADTVRTAFNSTYFDVTQHTYSRTAVATGAFKRATQAVLATALFVDIVPSGEHDAVLASLVAETAQPGASKAKPNHVNTGIVGTYTLFSELSKHGLSDLAYQLATEITYPSIFVGPSGPEGTFWEKTTDDAISHNHPAFGSVDTWLWRGVLGIDTDRLSSTGVVDLHPSPITGVHDVNGTIRTVRGPVSSGWSRPADDQVDYTIATPPGTRSVVSLAVADDEQIAIDGVLQTLTEPDPDNPGRYLFRIDHAGTTVLSIAPAAPVVAIDPRLHDVTVSFATEMHVAVEDTTAAQLDVTGLPPGLAFDPATSTVRGTPTSPGTYDVTFATGSDGRRSITARAITVHPQPVCNEGQPGVDPNEWSEKLLTGSLGPTATGFRSTTTVNEYEPRCLIVAYGRHQTITSLDLYGLRGRAAWVDGDGFPIDYRVDVSNDASFGSFTTVATVSGSTAPNVFYSPLRVTATPQSAPWVFLRITATRLGRVGPGSFQLALARVFLAAETAGPLLRTGFPASLTSGRPFTWKVSAYGIPTPTTTISGLPPGLSFDPGTGIVTGTPSGPGTYRVTVALTNGIPNDVSNTYIVAVMPP